MVDQLPKTRIERVTVVDQIENTLKQRIISGRIKPGDKLPSESDIAQAYGVNRLSVRMALQKLATLGVIETKIGEGSYVRDFSIAPVLNEISDYYDSAVQMEEIQQMRQLLETASVTQAIKKANDEEMETLEECLNEYLKAFSDSRERKSKEKFRILVEKDFGFHAQIVHMAHNRLLEDIYLMVRNLMMAHIERLLHIRDVVDEKTPPDVYHTNLCKYIIDRDVKSAQALLQLIIHE